MATTSGRPEPLRSTVEVEVRYIETDQMGHVHHANYIAWFELARTRLCASTGIPYTEVEAMGYLMVVTAVEVRYRQPARYGETVAVTSWVERAGSRLTRFAYEVTRGADLLATGATEHLWVERQSRRPCRIPEPLRQPFARLAGAGGLW
ncbi:MAG TPA: thioesterase family protein [Thermoanaerobaculia bacterium]|nr:thioesterase family protein [Thermoanaerobaculia bacterium]